MNLFPFWAVSLAASILTAAGLVATTYLLAVPPQSPLRKSTRQYLELLQRELRFLLSNVSARSILIGQVATGAPLLLFVFLKDAWLLSPFVPVVVFAPLISLRSQRDKRTTRIEEQLDSWLLTLANALKASSSLGESIAASAGLMHAPISQEIDLLIKEYKLGTALDEAMKHMAERVRSRTVSSGLLTLRIARNTGGDLPKTLETAAASLREMARLEGVVRTKTAEGKAQAWVIGAMPFPLVGILNWMNGDFLSPLLSNFKGHLVIAVATLLWLAAIFSARKILAVDI
jgi:tight adherence protein B